MSNEKAVLTHLAVRAARWHINGNLPPPKHFKQDARPPVKSKLPHLPPSAVRKMIAAVPPDLTFHYWFLPQAYAVVPLLEELLAARIDHTRITNERKRVARMEGRERLKPRLHRCSVCSGELPEGSRLDRRTCSDACRQKEHRADEKARRNYVLTLKHTNSLPEPDGSFSAETVAEIDFDTNLAIERLAAARPDGVVSDFEKGRLRHRVWFTYHRRRMKAAGTGGEGGLRQGGKSAR